jgi:hypothetical protein
LTSRNSDMARDPLAGPAVQPSIMTLSSECSGDPVRCASVALPTRGGVANASFKAIRWELFGVVVADPRFTLALMVWIAIAATILRFVRDVNGVAAILLFLGFAIMLVENVLHAALIKNQTNCAVTRGNQRPKK